MLYFFIIYIYSLYVSYVVTLLNVLTHNVKFIFQMIQFICEYRRGQKKSTPSSNEESIKKAQKKKDGIQLGLYINLTPGCQLRRSLLLDWRMTLHTSLVNWTNMALEQIV